LQVQLSYAAVVIIVAVAAKANSADIIVAVAAKANLPDVINSTIVITTTTTTTTTTIDVRFDVVESHY